MPAGRLSKCDLGGDVRLGSRARWRSSRILGINRKGIVRNERAIQTQRRPFEARRRSLGRPVNGSKYAADAISPERVVPSDPSPEGGSRAPLKISQPPGWCDSGLRTNSFLRNWQAPALDGRPPKLGLRSVRRGRRNFRPPTLTKAVALATLLIILAGCSRLGNKGFEWGNFLGWIPEFPESYSGRIVESPVRCGNYAARFEYRPGDEAWTGGYRSEVSESLSKAAFNVPVWYAFSTYIPNTFRGEAVISQWHATPDAGEVWRSPPLALRYNGETLRVTARDSDIPIQQDNSAPERDLYVTPLARETWNDWVFRVVWSHESGSVDAWLNGAKVIEYRGPIGYRDARGPFFKIGIYNQGMPHVQVVYHDEYFRSDYRLPLHPC